MAEIFQNAFKGGFGSRKMSDCVGINFYDGFHALKSQAAVSPDAGPGIQGQRQYQRQHFDTRMMNFVHCKLNMLVGDAINSAIKIDYIVEFLALRGVLFNGNVLNTDLILKTASLLIHAAKIDENYTSKEKSIIKETLLTLDSEISDIEKLMIDAENNEKNSNQILDFTKELKNADQSFKVKVIEILWKIIYSNKEVDMYEANLMSRLSGLLYLDKKIAAEIKEKVKKDF